MECKEKDQINKGNNEFLQDFQTFFDFWKLPLELVSNRMVTSGKQFIGFKLSSPARMNPTLPKFYHWQNSCLFVPILENKVTSKTPSNIIRDQLGNSVGEVIFNEAESELILPFSFDEAINNLRFEKYLKAETTQPLVSMAREGFYSIKPLLPRFLQLAMRKGARRVMGKRAFPTWPVDMNIELLQYDLLKTIISTRADLSLPVLSFWPGGEDFCLVITHDVESQIGYDNLSELVRIEKKYGFRSSWNFVPKSYNIDINKLKQLEEDGFECGIHGLYHDGKLFKSKEIFLKQAEEINKYVKTWGSVGFRSPSLIRKMDWISDHINVEYDTSSPTTEWYGAQPGGCCTVFPFKNNKVIELPITLQQDHTLLEILEMSPEKMVEQWFQSIHSIKEASGMVLINVHPDYFLDMKRLEAYEEFLKLLKQENNYWHALPKDVARWWKERQNLQIEWKNDAWIISGNITSGGKIMIATLDKSDIPRLIFQPI